MQSVNALDRTAYVRYTDNGNVELASVLELDPHGSSDWSSVSPVEGLGLHRGEFIFIHLPGGSNGAQYPMVPRIGEMEDWVRESPMMHVENGQLAGWRRTMAEIGNDIAKRRGKDPAVEEGKLRRPQPNNASLNWFGEVVDVSIPSNYNYHGKILTLLYSYGSTARSTLCFRMPPQRTYPCNG